MTDQNPPNRDTVDPDSVFTDGKEQATPDFIDEEEAQLFAIARLGMETQHFFNSEVGRLMLGYAKQEINHHAMALLDVDPSDTEKVNEHRFKAGVARLFISFVNEAINSGSAAYQQLDAREQE